MLTDRQASLLPRIYDAAVAENLWPSALDAVAEAANSRTAALLALDNLGLPFAIAEGSRRMKPEDLKYYQDNLIEHEVAAWTYIQTRPAGTIVRDEDIWPIAPELEQRPDNKWMIEKWGVLRRAAVRLNDSPGWTDSLTFQYDRAIKSVPPSTTKLAQALIPHVAKVVELHRTFAILRSRYQAVLGALDRMKIGVCVTSHYGDVIVSNNEAERIFSLTDGLALGKDKRFLCADSEATGRLALAIRDSICTVNGSGNTQETIIAVQRHSGAHPFLVEVSPLSDSVGELERLLKGSVVFIVDPENPRPFSVENVARCFPLSQTELQICALMVQGLTDVEIAAKRAVSVETVRTQVKAVYRKTNTRRRAELIRLTLNITPPIEEP